MEKIFGTDGVRGMANVEPMSAETVLEIGRATAYVCGKYHEHKETRPRIVIGKDTRLSGYMLENALTAGLTSMGADVFLVGPVPTPGIAFITKSMRADAGIVISASHNPYYDNGIKIFSQSGYKLPDTEEDEIDELVSSGSIRNIRSTKKNLGKAKRIDDARGRYIEFCKKTFPDEMALDGLKIVLDCANGATYQVAPIIFYELGAEVITIHASPNGTNINDNCGSQFTADLSEKVREVGADAGLAFDGDGDRLIAVDEKGCQLSGDHLMAIFTAHFKESGLLRNDLVIGTVMSNFGFHTAMRDMGLEVGVAPVGDRNVLEMMRERGAALGGEASGHIIFDDYHTTGDGIVTALQLMAIRKQTERTLSSLAEVMDICPQKLINVPVDSKPDLESIDELQTAISEAESELNGEGRVLIRYSGTQPFCRVMVEGPTDEMTQRLAQKLAKTVEKTLG